MTSSPRAVLPAVVAAFVLAGCARSRDAAAAQATSAPSKSILAAEDIERSPGIPLEQLLVARIPGLAITRGEDGQLALRVRGTSTIMGDTEPLYVLDGIPLEPRPGGNLNAVNRYDIASIEVLKDPASTAMYGLRGAGGVILIRTKRPPQ